MLKGGPDNSLLEGKHETATSKSFIDKSLNDKWETFLKRFYKEMLTFYKVGHAFVFAFSFSVLAEVVQDVAKAEYKGKYST